MHPYHEAARPNGERVLTVFLPDGPLVVPGDHPQYDEVFDSARSGAAADEIVSLVDLSVAVAARFDKLTERISVSGGQVFFDGDPIRSSLTDHIVRALEDGSDFRPLVNFYEKLAANPNDHSREQLYDWLDLRDFVIAPDGDLYAYKGCGGTADAPLSGWSGTAIVDGETITGKIPNKVGSTIEMPRSKVRHDPSTACSTGLHAGTYSYAKGYANGVLLLVKINPRDVVSVPTDGGGEKFRVSRYEVVSTFDAPRPIQSAVYDWEDPDEGLCECGESLDDCYC
jgi:hypothetical protein